MNPDRSHKLTQINSLLRHQSNYPILVLKRIYIVIVIKFMQEAHGGVLGVSAMENMVKYISYLYWVAAVIVIILNTAGLVACVPGSQVNINLSDAIALSKTNNIKSLVLEGNSGTMTIIAAV